MSEHPLTNTVEAVLLAAGRPVSVAQILELFDEHERPPAEDVEAALADLARRYESTGAELREVASGWRVQVRQQHADVVSRLWQERPSRYSRALLETLALIAYRQPITRGEIEDIRGVTVASTIMRTLHERNWIRIVGHREVPGRPELLGTTREFLDYFGLKSLDDLPTLAQLQDLEDLNVQLELPGSEATVAAALPAPEGAAADDAGMATDAGDVSASGGDADEEEGGEDSEEESTLDDDTSVDAEATGEDGERVDPDAPTMVASPPDGHER